MIGRTYPSEHRGRFRICWQAGRAMATAATRRRWTRFGAPARVDGRMLLGVALVAAAVIGGLLFLGSARETVPVLVAARDLPPRPLLPAYHLSVAHPPLQ